LNAVFYSNGNVCSFLTTFRYTFTPVALSGGQNMRLQTPSISLRAYRAVGNQRSL